MSSLGQITACSWTAWSHYLNQCWFNSLRPRRNRRYNADDIFKCIFLRENAWIPTKISLKFVPKGPINNIPALVQIMAWRRPGDKPLSEPMMVSLLTHICVTRPQWVRPNRVLRHSPGRNLIGSWKYCNMSQKIALLKLLQYRPVVNELITPYTTSYNVNFSSPY